MSKFKPAGEGIGVNFQNNQDEDCSICRFPGEDKECLFIFTNNGVERAVRLSSIAEDVLLALLLKTKGVGLVGTPENEAL